MEKLRKLKIKFVRWFLIYIGAYIDFICSCIRIITLDFYYPNWSFAYIRKIAIINLYKNIQKEEK